MRRDLGRLVCPTCQNEVLAPAQFCPRDGAPLSEAPPRVEEASDPLVGRVLGGRYRLVARIGQGGMGTVYRGLHTLMDKPVAIKILRPELASNAEAVTRFHREAKSCSRLDHEHCIRISDFGQSEDGLLFLVMELLEGRTLTARIQTGRSSPAEAVAIIRATAEALGHAHEQGLVHRDLKPDNILLARRPRGGEVVKVVDFGLAKLLEGAGPSVPITADGIIFGTPEYMAPEQAKGDPLDGRTDLYALGVILFELLTGSRPFQAANFMALLTMHVSDRPPSPRSRHPGLDLPDELEAIVMRCLAKRPEQRFESARALIEALDALPPLSGGTTPEAAPPMATGEHQGAQARTPPGTERELGSDSARLESVLVRRPRRLRLALLGAVVLGGLGFGAVQVVRHTPAPTPPQVPAPARVRPPRVVEAERLVLQGNLDGAERLLKAERKTNESSALFEVYALLAERRGARTTALSHLERALRLDPTSIDARAEQLRLLVAGGPLSDACESARRLLQLAPSSPKGAPARALLESGRCGEPREGSGRVRPGSPPR